MTQPESTWQELSERLDALALKLKMHLAQVKNDGTPEAVRDLRTAVDDAFTAAGNAIRDEAVGADVREAGRLFVDAFTATLARAGDDVRDALEHRTGRT
jgi:phosphomannomutase